ncbi:GNAT family N-acetyltransferase [Levilactobacillus spicheri]|uniref:Acetyltransferase n=1 Tax=Levilactobacillus spicheri TaxID=216463 RepID=A0A0F3RUW0_9LACO|nr:N-acetyltransferase [Levilactobacillus spicheri]KJW13803.1 acetyltransferase [Levilactobacillus spicheri]
MNLSFETIQPTDYDQVDELVAQAFAPIDESDGSEVDLIHQLRTSYDYQPSLEMVVKPGHGEIVAHGLLTPVTIRGDRHTTSVLALAPLAVAPDYQRQGIGSQLMVELESRAQLAGYPAISVVGNSTYYGRHGYVMAEDFAIHNTLPVPMGNHLIKALKPGALAHVGGMLEYPAAFHKF